MKKAILDGLDLIGTSEIAFHAEWAREVVARHPELCADNARAILESEIGDVFLEVLMDAGVYKRDEAGRAALDRFISSL